MDDARSSLSALFLTRAGGDRPARIESAPALEEALRARLASARAAWPGVEVDAERFICWLAERVPEAGEPRAALAQLWTDELYLTCACAHLIPGAVAAFERHVMPAVRAGLERTPLWSASAEDVLQVWRLKHLVASSEAPVPRIAGYQGRGSLVGWVRFKATRLARDLARTCGETRREGDERIMDDLLATGLDAEGTCLRAEAKELLRQAFRGAWAALPSQRRNLLRRYFRDGMTLEEIGSMIGRHKTVACRQLQASKEALAGEALRLLATEHPLSAGELAGLVRSLGSSLELGLRWSSEGP